MLKLVTGLECNGTVKIMSNLRLFAMLAVSSLFLSAGCSGTVANYSVSAESQVVLRNIKEKNAAMVGVGNVAYKGVLNSTNRTVSCRLISVAVPSDRQTFPNYIRVALIDELRVAGVYDDKNYSTIQVNIAQIELVSVGVFVWKIKADFSIGVDKPIVYTSIVEYPFTSAFDAGTACNNAAQAFPAAVQKLIGQFFQSKEFSEFMAKKK